MRQRRHSPRVLAWRGVIAALSDVAMASGIYPLLPHAALALSRKPEEDRAAEAADAADRPSALRIALREWRIAIEMSAARPLGFLPLPGEQGRGPRPIILLHGYAMCRANFRPLARRLEAAGLGPVLGFEYWTLGKTSAAAKRLAEYVEEVRARSESDQVDIIGHSMGGVVGRYYVSLLGGDGAVANLITLGSPHAGTDVSAVGLGRPGKELLGGSTLVQRLDAAPRPTRTRMTVVWSRADALVPGARHARVTGVDELVYDDLGHLALLTDERVAAA
ncbi:MAG: alpha/beta fold hydrolase, partial [Deltaproteobacteria bacterium]|nr:alpha/beta fold hydrolase [Kofleriaceae bacterium]